MRHFTSTSSPGICACATAMLAGCLLLAVPGYAAAAEVGNGRLPISIFAEKSNIDTKSNMLVFEGLQLSQGSVGIEADEGRASKLDFKNSVWKFSGNVVIDLDSTHIECESAEMEFADHELRLATIQGAPATFRQGALEDVDSTVAEAGFLEYDFAKGQVVFEQEALITQGGNRISSDRLVYSIENQIVIARSEVEGERNVKITIVPPEDGEAAPAEVSEAVRPEDGEAVPTEGGEAVLHEDGEAAPTEGGEAVLHEDGEAATDDAQ